MVNRNNGGNFVRTQTSAAAGGQSQQQQQFKKAGNVDRATATGAAGARSVASPKPGAQQASSTASSTAGAAAGGEAAKLSCEPCEKEFTTETARQAHLLSHVPCPEKGCGFSALRKIVNNHHEAKHGQFSGSGFQVLCSHSLVIVPAPSRRTSGCRHGVGGSSTGVCSAKTCSVASKPPYGVISWIQESLPSLSSRLCPKIEPRMIRAASD